MCILANSFTSLGTGTTGGGANWIGYLTTAENKSLVLNYNLAIGGATISNNLVPVAYEDMTSQVATFESSYSSKPVSAPWTSQDAVFGFWIGINEYVLLFHFYLIIWSKVTDEAVSVSETHSGRMSPVFLFRHLWRNMRAWS